MSPPFRVLLLAGTLEARRLADALAARPGIAATASLAGATDDPAPHAVPVRRGGFGGAAGLADWLGGNGIGAVIDATHPFAVRISANAATAAAATGVALLRLQRPGWQAGPADDWLRVPDEARALAALPRGAVALLALGAGGLDRLASGSPAGVRLIARAIRPPDVLPVGVDLIVGRPPADAADEAAMMRARGVTHVVARDAGGTGGAAKLAAARALGLPVILIDRPPAPPGVAIVDSAGAALAWLDGLTHSGAGSVQSA